MDPLIASLSSALPESKYCVEALASVLTYLRVRHTLEENDLRLPPRAALPALMRRLTRALGRLSVPEPNFECPAGYRFVMSAAELQRIGKAFGNCVASPQWQATQHHFRLISGAGVYLVSDVPPLLVALVRVEGHLWVLEQVAGPKNTAPPPGAQDALLRGLATAGLRIISVEPAAALSRLEAEMTRQRRRAAQDEDADEDEHDDDGELAA